MAAYPFIFHKMGFSAGGNVTIAEKKRICKTIADMISFPSTFSVSQRNMYPAEGVFGGGSYVYYPGGKPV